MTGRVVSCCALGPIGGSSLLRLIVEGLTGLGSGTLGRTGIVETEDLSTATAVPVSLAFFSSRAVEVRFWCPGASPFCSGRTGSETKVPLLLMCCSWLGGRSLSMQLLDGMLVTNSSKLDTGFDSGRSISSNSSGSYREVGVNGRRESNDLSEGVL